MEIKKHCFQRLEFVSSEFGRWFVSMQLQCFFVCLQTLICAIASFWQVISWVFFCSFFCIQSGALSLPICCVLELKHAMCCLLELKSLTRVVPQCFNGFHWFCHGLHVLNGFGWNLSGLHYFSTMFMDFWIDLMDFLMIFIFIFLFNHSLILDGVALFKVIYSTEFIDAATVFINCHVFIDFCMAFQSVFRDTRCTQQ